MEDSDPIPNQWDDACLVAALLSLSPRHCKGVAIRGRHGPVRDAWLHLLDDLCGKSTKLRRLPAHASEQRILGGLDLAATLKAGFPVADRGILADANGDLLVATMAERMNARLAAQIGQALDNGKLIAEREGLRLKSSARFGLVVLDESLDDEPPPSDALLEPLAFRIGLEDIPPNALDNPNYTADCLVAARERLPRVFTTDQVIEALCAASLRLGISSVRACTLAANVATVHAALKGRTETSQQDAEAALRLVLVPRATQWPQDEVPEEQEPEPPEPSEAPDNRGENSDDPPDLQELTDILVEAAKAILPRDLLTKVAMQKSIRARAAAAGRSGVGRSKAPRGRRAGTRPGQLTSGQRLNIVETLRAAAPWQTVRRRMNEGQGANGQRIEIRPDDIRIQKFHHPTESTIIFLVDASGSAAAQRLGEAKGAAELLLADCYVRRDQVALIAFRGKSAELVLPPTKSLVRAKRALTGLAGGGGTPLADALHMGGSLAQDQRKRGRSPILVLLTDGQANIAKDGTQGRAQASADALSIARALRAQGIQSLLLDISPRPRAAAAELATALDAHLELLPYADAQSVSNLVRREAASANSGL